MLMHKIRSHMRASDVCARVCVCGAECFRNRKNAKLHVCRVSISLMWICIDVNDAMGDTSTPARQNSTAHWANTLMVNKNKLCARSLAHMNNDDDNCSHVSPAFRIDFYWPWCECDADSGDSVVFGLCSCVCVCDGHQHSVGINNSTRRFFANDVTSQR